MNIALVFDDTVDHPGGVAHYLQTLAAGLMAQGHVVSLLVGESTADLLGDAPVRTLARNVPVRFNGGAGSMPLPARSRRLDAVLADGAFDVVHVQVPFSPFLAGRLIRRLGDDVALVGTYHVTSSGPIATMGARALGAISRRSLRRFDAMLAVSETAATSARRWFGVRDCEVVPSPIDVDAIAAVADAAATRRGTSSCEPARLFHLGALTRRKGADAFIDAVRILVGRGVIVDAVLAGVGPRASALRRRAAGLPIRFLGAVSEFEKAELLGVADIACFPARGGESLGVVLLEAMAAGTPVVAGQTAGYVETLRDDGVVCGPTGAATAAAIETLLADPARQSALAERGREGVLRYDTSVVTASMLAVYRRALVRRRGSGVDAVSSHA